MRNSVGYDLFACIKTESGRDSTRIIPAQHTVAIGCGVSLVPPRGCFLLVCSRSGLASHGVFVANAPGVIDPDYTGEVMVLLFNGGWQPYYVKHGDRIAQILVMLCPLTPTINPITELPQTDRGNHGFGSTGR